MNMNAQDLALRAERYLCLARSFIPPTTEPMFQGMVEHLVADLRDIGTQMNAPDVDATLDALDAALRAVPEQESLLRGYSRLFLSPPVKVALNAGLHLDGGVMGASTVAMQDFYQRHGVTRGDDFKDLPDHLSIQLEFVTLLYAKAAELDAGTDRDGLLIDLRDFIHHYLAPWLPALARKLDVECGDDPTMRAYRDLALLLSRHVAHDLTALCALYPLPEPELPSERIAAEDIPDLPPETSAEAVAIMIERLREAGLSTEHLEQLQTERDFNLGMQPLKPISHRKSVR